MTTLRQTSAAVRAFLALTVVFGLIYPLAMTAAGRLMFHQTDGSLVTADNRVVGSSLIGQPFTGDRWFNSRPSATDYDGTSSASNYGQNSPDQAEAVSERRNDLTAANPDAVGPVPADALTASASGLDPDISVAYARWQAPRVAAARGVSVERVQQLISRHAAGPNLGFLGQERCNVLELNLALEKLAQHH